MMRTGKLEMLHMSYHLRRKNADLSRRLMIVLSLLAIAMMWTSALLPGAASAPWDEGDVGPASPGPDLNAASGDLSLSDTTPDIGQNVTVQLTVRNTGDQGAWNFTVELYDGDDTTGTLVQQWMVPTVGANSSKVLSTVWVAKLGDHDLTMYLDTTDFVSEDSETNNEASVTVSVGGIPDVRLEGGAFLISTNQEGSVTITADAFNGGTAVATGYKMGFYNGDPDASGILIGRPSLADIPVGGRASAQQSWVATEGQYHLYARVESTDAKDPTANDGVDRRVWITADVMAVAGPDQAAFAGQDLTFNGSGSSAAGGPIANYTWDMGDGTTLYGAGVSHNYTNAGTTVRTVTVKLTVKDGSGGTDSDTCTVYINPLGSSPPTADAGTAPTGTTNQNMSFDGSSSTGNITSYIWDFGDGTGATGVSPVHTYADDGLYTVSLAVISNLSLADVDVIQVTVTNQGPVVQDIDDISTDVGVSHDLLVMATDADGYIASYLWDLGDGSTSTLRDPSHTWTSDGPHSCSVNVTDDDGASTVVSFWVNVTDVAPVASFTTDTVRNEGQTVRVDGRATTEPGDDIVLWQWDWDSDGTFDNATGPSSETVYNKPGYYNITLKVTDGEGSTNETKREVLVNNVAPTAQCTLSTRTVMEGDPVTFDCSASSEPGDNIIRYYFDWDGDAVYDFNTTESAVNHTYVTLGRFYARVMVEDEDGTFDDYASTWWMRIDVTNAPPLVNESESFGVEGENTTITVDAYEPGNNLVEFGWDFDGDYVPDAYTNVSYINYTFWSAGRFTVWVKVTDEDHTEANPSWGGGQIYINVTDVAPKPSVEGGQATEGEPTPFTATMRGTEENISLFQFDLDGDGTFEISSTTWTTDLIFTDTGDLECLIRVVDTDGTEGIALFNVFVHDVAPVVTGPAFLLVAEGDPFEVVVSAHEPGMDIVRYEFDWNADGAADDTSTEPTSSHTYNSPGAKRIVVTAVDEDGSTGNVGIQVLVSNTPPVADAGTPAQTYEGELVELNASLSTEAGNHIVSYEWDYDADGLFDFTTRDATHAHAWDAPGLYTIMVRVIDADGTFDEATATVIIEDKEPLAGLSVQMMPEDVPTMLDASTSSDPGGIALYEWNITATGQRVDVATTVPYLMFTFDRRVRYEIKLTVTDHEGSIATTEYVVAIDDVLTNPPTVTYEAPSLVMEDDSFTLRAWADDPFPDDEDLLASRMIEFSWDMGDGSFVRKGDTVTHVYDRAGAEPYQVTLTVIDEDNDRVTVMVANITVLNPSPVIMPVSPITVKAGGKGETTVEASDGTTPVAELVFELDPNAPDWVSLTGNTLRVEPGENVPGATYMIVVMVTDGLGVSSSTQVPVVVTTDAVESGVGWGSILGLMVVFLLIAIVVAVLVSTRMRPPGGAKKEPSSKGTDYENLYGEEPRRKVRAVAKVDTERVDVTTEEPPVPDYVTSAAAASAAAYPTPSTPEPEPEPVVDAPLPSWMSSTKVEEVHLEERSVDPPPAIPPEWQATPDDPADQPYQFKKPPEGQKQTFKGAGGPKQ